tara:strand:+ start:136 stop:396 length:261 start_codon:yes stop_codon:yes gene_type:complete
MKFEYNDGTDQVVGNMSGKVPKRYELKEGERIVGISFKQVKPMYRYNLQFVIAPKTCYTKVESEIVDVETIEVVVEEEPEEEVSSA